MSHDSRTATTSWRSIDSGRPPGPATTSAGRGDGEATRSRGSSARTASAPRGARAPASPGRRPARAAPPRARRRRGPGGSASRRRAATLGGPVVEERAAAGMRRPEALDGRPQRLGRRGQLRQALGEHEAHPGGVGQRLAEDDALAPRPAFDERRAQDDGAQRAPVALAAGEEAVDEQLERPSQLLSGGRLLELERLLEDLSRTARSQRGVATVGEVVGQQPGRAEAIGERRPWQRGEVAERRIPSRSRPSGRAAVSSRKRSNATGSACQFGRPGDDRRAPRARARRRRRARRSATVRRPIRAGRRRAPRDRRDDAVERAAVEAAKAARVEAGEPGTVGLDRRADRLERPSDPLPGVGDPDRVGRHERQTRAARERLAQAHPGMDAERLGRRARPRRPAARGPAPGRGRPAPAGAPRARRRRRRARIVEA